METWPNNTFQKKKTKNKYIITFYERESNKINNKLQ